MFAAKDVHSDEVYAVGGDELEGVVELHVGCWKAYGAAYSVASDHYAKERVVVAKHLRGLFDPSLTQHIPNQSRTNRPIGSIHCVSNANLQPCSPCHRSDLNRRKPIRAKAIIVAKDESSRAKALFQHFNILYGRHSGELARKLHHLHPIHSKARQKRFFLLQRGE